jgi:arylsulfatase A-like enzyme
MLYYNNSLVLSFLYGLFYQSRIKANVSSRYPNGYPIGQYYDHPFTMESLFDGIAAQILDLHHSGHPYFSYFHIYPPHHPYAPSAGFSGMFDKDGYKPVEKRSHPLADGDGQTSLDVERANYDAFIVNIDAEIGRLMETLEAQGILEHTYFVITSDHGEMFERGTDGHVTPMLYDPVVHSPLMIFAPGNQTRRDFTTPTQNIDLLPTILHLAGGQIPTSAEGRILPGLGGTEDPNRILFIVEAKESASFNPFTKATYAVIKGNYKLIHYSGYKNKYDDYYEFYDLEQDVEELQDKYAVPRFQPVIEEMKRELVNEIAKADLALTSPV